MLLADSWTQEGRKDPALILLLRIPVDRANAFGIVKRIVNLIPEPSGDPTFLRFMRRWHALAPLQPIPLRLLGMALFGMLEYRDARHLLRQLVHVQPQRAKNHWAMASTIMALGDVRLSIAAATRAVALGPGEEANWMSLALCLTWQPDAVNAVKAAHIALDLASKDGPPSEKAKHNASLVLLAAGQLDPGWHYHESRIACYPDKYPVPAGIPRWQGEPLEGKSILIFAEQGMGDEFVFSTCYRDVIRRARRTIIATRPKLVRLMQRSFPGAEVVVRGDDLPGAPDWFEYAGSLPRYFRRNRADFDVSPPLRADSAKVRRWRDWLDGLGPGPKIGFFWRSGPVRPQREPDIPCLGDWAPVLSVGGAVFVTLQDGNPDADIEGFRQRYGITLHQPPDIDLRNDLDDIAALASGLDLTIAILGSVPHMVAALGCPCWLLMRPGEPLGLFGLDRRGFPFHPTAKTFIKDHKDGWAHVMQEVAQGLRDIVKDRGGNAVPE